MIIEKLATDAYNHCYQEFFYQRARDGMHDIVWKMHSRGYIDSILLPGYIGWSPKEGSGIFDSISNIEGIKINYYRVDENLTIDKKDLCGKIDADKCLVLVVNYFGFRDPAIEEIVYEIKSKNAWILEDNAHGFYTYHLTEKIASDISVFSLHKMFPFENGGSLIIQNPKLAELELEGKNWRESDWNPYQYDIFRIAQKRKENFRYLAGLLQEFGKMGIVKSLRTIDDLERNVPQTYPIILYKGNRNRVYEIMNKKGYGVVSLYHTLIKPLQNKEFREAVRLSECIMNLPVHQDITKKEYSNLIQELINACEISEREK